jgi:hypothetical protein
MGLACLNVAFSSLFSLCFFGRCRGRAGSSCCCSSTSCRFRSNLSLSVVGTWLACLYVDRTSSLCCLRFLCSDLTASLLVRWTRSRVVDLRFGMMSISLVESVPETVEGIGSHITCSLSLSSLLRCAASFISIKSNIISRILTSAPQCDAWPPAAQSEHEQYVHPNDISTRSRIYVDD